MHDKDNIKQKMFKGHNFATIWSIDQNKIRTQCEIILFCGGSIFVVFIDTINNEFRSPTNNDV